MLVLSRKVNQQIHVGNDIVITIVEVRDGRVRLGFDAPKCIPIHRAEVYAKIQQPKEAEAAED